MSWHALLPATDETIIRWCP